MKSKADVRDAGQAFLLCEDMLVQSYKDWIDREAECMEIAREWKVPTEQFEELWAEWKDKREIEEWNAKREKIEVPRQAATKEVIREKPELPDGVKPAVRDIEAEIKAKAEAKTEASFILPTVQPIRVEPKVEVAKPDVRWKQMSDGKWSYSVNGGMYRRHFGPPPKHLEKPVEEPEGGVVVALKPQQQEKPEPEPEPEPRAEGEFEECLADVRLNLSAPYDIAKTFLRLAEDAAGQKRYVFIGKVGAELIREPILRRWKGDFKHWNGQCYQDVDDEDIRTQLYAFLDKAHEPSGNRIKPKQKHVNEVIDGLKAGTNPGSGDAPFWIGRKGPEPRGLLVCKNGLLELETGRLWDHDPRLFCLNGVDFDFNPRAQAARWKRFLDEVWPEDEGSIETLQEFFGLWVTDVTKFQKALGLFGKPRSGKGTIGRVAKGLLGNTSFTSVSLMDLGDKFGMEHLIGKKLALVPDVKLDGRMNITTIMQRLLETMGEDPIAFNRKNQKFWEGTLGIRWLILGNDVPRFRGTDEAGALAARMVMLKTDQSFLGREDWDLTEKLLAERAGILNWAMEGWRRLRWRDRFIQPTSGIELLQKLRANTSTIGTFVTECCELGDFRVEHAVLWAAFCEWSERRKVPLTLSTNTFSGALHEVFDHVSTSRPRAGMPSERPLFQYGIKLKDGWCPWRH